MSTSSTKSKEIFNRHVADGACKFSSIAFAKRNELHKFSIIKFYERPVEFARESWKTVESSMR